MVVLVLVHVRYCNMDTQIDYYRKFESADIDRVRELRDSGQSASSSIISIPPPVLFAPTSPLYPPPINPLRCHEMEKTPLMSSSSSQSNSAYDPTAPTMSSAISASSPYPTSGGSGLPVHHQHEAPPTYEHPSAVYSGDYSNGPYPDNEATWRR